MKENDLNTLVKEIFDEAKSSMLSLCQKSGVSPEEFMKKQNQDMDSYYLGRFEGLMLILHKNREHLRDKEEEYDLLNRFYDYTLDIEIGD